MTTRIAPEKKTATAIDNPYIVVFAPDEFHEVLTEIADWLAHLEATAPRYDAVRRAVAKLQAADATHICLDELEA